jgi:HEAT repeat protein
MDDSIDPSDPERFAECLVECDPFDVASAVDRLEAASVRDRKACLRALRPVAEDRAGEFDAVVPALVPQLEDGPRSVRLAVAKLFVAVASVDHDPVLPVVPAIAERLADGTEFYYVRARSAEALGYVALGRPDAVASPGVLADLRVGLSFDERAVREKLAKALAHVAIGDPERLRHQSRSLADHLDDDAELVRYHLCSALVAVGGERPEGLADAVQDLEARLDDPEPYVRGRAAEALGAWRRGTGEPVPERRLEALADHGDTFAAERARFALAAGLGLASEDSLGTPRSVRETTEAAVEAITSPPECECPNCGLELAETGPPVCPRCGAPR